MIRLVGSLWLFLYNSLGCDMLNREGILLF